MADAITTSPVHTAGPWEIEDRRESYDSEEPRLILVGDSGSKELALLYSESYGAAEHTEEEELADVAEYAANARLIAKAPDLLAALKGLTESIGPVEAQEHMLDCQEPEACTLCIARKVIAEAEGS